MEFIALLRNIKRNEANGHRGRNQYPGVGAMEADTLDHGVV